MKRRSLRHLLPKIIERDGNEWKCHYCKRPLIPAGIPIGTAPYFMQVKAISENGIVNDWVTTGNFDFPYIDHKQPLSKGGSDDLSNLVVACRSCNQAKLITPYDEFVAGGRQ